jgi:hypothetical protein
MSAQETPSPRLRCFSKEGVASGFQVLASRTRFGAYPSKGGGEVYVEASDSHLLPHLTAFLTETLTRLHLIDLLNPSLLAARTCDNLYQDGTEVRAKTVCECVLPKRVGSQKALFP